MWFGLHTLLQGRTVDSAMDDLVTRLADLFRRYRADFCGMARMTKPEMAQTTELFREEVDALIAEHGPEAVVQAALRLSTKSPIVH